MKTLCFVFGTRPEAIKLAPVILQAQQQRDRFVTRVCVTGQHRQMLDSMLELFGISPDADLNLMRPNQSLADLSARTLQAVSEYLATSKPDWVLVQGDTTTVWAAAVAAFFLRVPVAHVEAGLRTGDKFQPFPEEINRRIATQVADLHLAPTQWAANNLLREGVSADKVLVTGNTVIDALHWVLARNRLDPTPDVRSIRQWLVENVAGRDMVLVTGHRRESFGDGFRHICQAIGSLAREYPQVAWVYPVHLNPNVQQPVRELLSNLPNVFLLDPQPYAAFAELMQASRFILTDSGGVQEEAPSLGKHVLVMRNTTERPEGIEAGVVQLVGNQKDSIIHCCQRLLEHAPETVRVSPYGDGRASARILEALG